MALQCRVASSFFSSHFSYLYPQVLIPLGLQINGEEKGERACIDRTREIERSSHDLLALTHARLVCTNRPGTQEPEWAQMGHGPISYDKLDKSASSNTKSTPFA